MIQRCLPQVLILLFLLTQAACQSEGVFIQGEVLAPFRQVPAVAVVEQADVMCEVYTHDGQADRYTLDRGYPVGAWLNADRFSELTREFFQESSMFQAIRETPPDEADGMYLVLKPRLTVKQYIRPSFRGAVLTVGTGLIYNLLGGPDAHRQAECDLVIDVETPQGRPLATYAANQRSAERLLADRPDQLGPLVSYAFTKVLEETANQMSVENDILMKALTADLAAKGVVPIARSGMRISVDSPKAVIVRERQSQIRGQVSGVTEPVELMWSLNGAEGGVVDLQDTTADSVKRFALPLSVQEGVAKVALSLRSKSANGPQAELARTEMAFVCVPGEQAPLPEIRQRWAVIIGVSEYEHGGERFSNLRYAAKDGQALAEFLCNREIGGFKRENVLCLFDEQATAENVRHAMFEFLAKADRDDLVMIYFSGHGMPQPGTQNYFMLCHDTDPAKLASTAFPMWDIDTALRRFIKAERVVVFADACHAGGIAPLAGARGDSDNLANKYLQQVALASPGRLILTASEASELSFESEKVGQGHGLFTWFLLQGLRGQADADRDGIVTAGELVEYVRGQVIEASDGKQHPNPSGQYDRNLPLSMANSGP
jgi:hypothetical protein